MAEQSSKFILQVPLDASGIANFNPDHPVKVVAYNRSGAVAGSAVARLDAKGKGSAEITFAGNPGGVRVAVGPDDATDEELKNLQTLTVNVSPGQWKEKTLKLNPIVISPYYWWWWGVWCQNYTINGRLVCADGSPVPGATVCAYDVDWWWWWISEQQVGCAVTDASGSFQITFRLCCGWYWWWWWEGRIWRVDPTLADLIVPILQKVPGIKIPPLPDPAPDLQIFESLLAQTSAPTLTVANNLVQQSARALGSVSASANQGAINPGTLETLRTQLLTRLPASAELLRLCVWPWCPWWPWAECDADILLRATQNCNGQNNVIYSESIWQARSDIPNQLNVTLVANDQACCLAQGCQDANCPAGDCVLPFDICATTAASVGGNPGADMAAPTIGYENPGGASPGVPGGDRPFSQDVVLSTNFGDAYSGDYYEFEWATSSSGPWSAMPPAANGGFDRVYWDAMLTQHWVPFPTYSINSPDGLRNVYESRQHYEANNSIGIGWDQCVDCNYPTLIVWQTDNNFVNGTYYLRMKSWTRPGYAGDLSNKKITPFCGDKPEDNYTVIAIDNRPDPGPSAGHPLDHPCGPGTVHICTTQPDCNIFSVTIGGQQAGACSNITAQDSDPVVIDFMVHDPDGMLAYYALSCNYGLDLTEDLIDVNGVHIGTIAPGVGPTYATSWIGPAAQIGPDYGSALTTKPMQGATAPIWEGGTIRLTTTVGALFPETCCYQLQLWVYKRDIVNCYYGIDTNGYYNLTELSFTVFKS
jgi:hypothetical protein